MPRRNRPKKRREGLPDSWKPKGKKRPRGWHHGPNRGEEFAQAEHLIVDAEARLA